MIGYLNKAIRSLVLIMPKTSGYVRTFKTEGKNNKLVSFRIHDEKGEGGGGGVCAINYEILSENFLFQIV